MATPTNIAFPNVPQYEGVPQLMRPIDATIAQQPIVAVSLGTLSSILGAASQQAPRWGIFDADGNQLGVSGGTTSVTDAIENLITGDSTAILSTLGIDYIKEMRISDFPLEAGSFASYNKVETPGAPTVTLAFAGSEWQRTNFLNAIDAACRSTDLYYVLTPEVSYLNHTIERYNYSRRSYKGATLLIVALTLKEIRQVSAAYATASPIVSPQNASATPQVNSGMTQPAAPAQSTLLSIFNKVTGLGGN